MKGFRYTIAGAGLLLFLCAGQAWGQTTPLNCVANAPVPLIVRAEANADLAGDLVLTCTGGNPAATMFVNFALFLNTRVTSNLTGPGANETEALLLIDEPQPAPVANISNGILFIGQAKGSPGALASGNVFTGMKGGALNELQWFGVPFVPPGAGTRVFRFTNVRVVAPAASSTAPPAIVAAISISGASPVPITSPIQTVGFVQHGLKFTSATAGPTLNLQLAEQFASAFKKRIENTGAGPTVAAKQNQPGFLHCTESGLNPDFGTVAPGSTGSANTGTRFAVKVSGMVASITNLVVPNNVISSGGQMVIQRLAPPYGASLSGGVLTTGTGLGVVPVAGGAATILYEVLPRTPFAGITGCGVPDSFSFAVHSSPGLPFGAATVVGSYAPLDPTIVISGPAPEPRFN